MDFCIVFYVVYFQQCDWWRQSIPELVVQVAGGDLEDHLGVPPGIQVRHLQQIHAVSRLTNNQLIGMRRPVLRIRIRDPVPSRHLDLGWVKNQDPDSASGMNNPDHISESLETIFLVKILKFFDADPGWKKV
jgi:hypothetical protein